MRLPQTNELISDVNRTLGTSKSPRLSNNRAIFRGKKVKRVCLKESEFVVLEIQQQCCIRGKGQFWPLAHIKAL